MKMRYIVGPKTIVLLNLLLVCVVLGDERVAEPLTESSLDKATVLDQKLNSAESKLKESESAGHKKVEIKGEQGHKEKFHKENDFKKKDVAHNAKSSSEKAGHENLKAGEESSKVNKKKSDELGHDEGKKTASKTKKQGDNINIHWDKGSGFVKQWNYDRGSKKKKGYHHEDEGKLKKYNKAYKAENNQVKKGHHLKYKKHDAGYKNGWDSNHWGHHKGAYGHDMKHGDHHAHGYHKKEKADDYHDGWNHGWNEHVHHGHHGGHQHHDDGYSGYDWRF